jgi:MFS family permease
LSVETSHDPGTVPPSPFDAEPTARVRAPWITGFVFAGLGWQVASQVPSTFTVPQQIKDIDPGGHVADFAWVNTIGTLSILFLGPLFGMLSDRTASRFGRRRPWIALGGIAGAAALVFSGTQNSVWGVGLGYLLQTVCVAALAAGMVTIVPDRVPTGQRGVVLGWGGVPQAAALIVGGVLVSLSKGYVGQYAALAALMVFVVLFAWRVADPVMPRERREPFSFAAYLANYRIQVRQYPDFGWALATRFLMVLGYGLGTLYTPYFLDDVLGFRNTPNDKSNDSHLLIVVAVNSVSTVALVVVAGWLSDRWGRRKPLVCAGSVVMAVAAAMLAVHQSWGMMLAAGAVLGLGYGVYLSVDGALVTQTLPSGADRGRDMGFANLMTIIPFAVVPPIAAVLIKFAGGYGALFWASAGVSVAGAGCIYRIRGVR